MNDIKILLGNCRDSSRRMRKQNSDFIRCLSVRQTSRYLWIGCLVNRVFLNETIGSQPGEMFAWRSVESFLLHAGLNCSSVNQYSVNKQKVWHLIRDACSAYSRRRAGSCTRCVGPYLNT